MQGIGFCRLKTWALAGASVAAIASPAWTQEAVRQFNIPAQEMAAALEAFGRQGDVDILFDRNTVRGLTSAAVEGAHAPEAALRRLVAGSGLSVRRVNGSTFLVERTGDNAATTTPATEVGELVVTGSRIRGGTVSSPVRVVTSDDIDASGYGNIGEVIRSLPENFAGGQNPGIVSTPTALHANATNSSTVNLRGLGSDATLVLLNGRRLPSDGLGQASDISTIPLAAIDRVEVVTDGSSAIYGSDAVAGVANFILKRNYDGAEVRARVGGATQGGGFEQNYSALVGKTIGDWHGFLGVEYLNRDDIAAGQRDFTSDAPPDSSLWRQEERTSAIASLGGALTEIVSVHLDALWSDRRAVRTDHYRASLSPQYNTVDLPTYSIAAGLQLDLPSGWLVRFDAGTASGDARSVTESGSSVSRQERLNESTFADAVLTGDLLSVPGGPVRIAVGGGYREESFRWRYTSSNIWTLGAEGSRDIQYIFGEAQVPLIAPGGVAGVGALDMNLSARYEDYSDVGTAFTHKVGLRYAATDDITLRATWGESFKAPSLYQLLNGNFAYYAPASIFGGTSGGNAIQASGGNRDLRPERSTSWTAGAEYRPQRFAAMTLGATYFNIDYTDRVVLPITTLTTALVNPAFAAFVVPNPTIEQQSEVISRAPNLINGTGAPYDPSTVVALVLNYEVNAAAQRAEGIDLSYRQSFPTRGGQIEAFANGTWISVKQRTLPTLPEVRLSGQIFRVPEFRMRAGATWAVGDLSATAILNFQTGSKDTGIVPARDIGSWTTFDANLAYDVAGSGPWEGVRIGLSVSNLFDEDPPYAWSPAVYHDGIHFDSANASAVGRFVALTLRKSF